MIVAKNDSPYSLNCKPSERSLMSLHGKTSRDAILRGLDFVHGRARDPDHFRVYGFDYLFMLLVSAKSKDSAIRSKALQMGNELARRWIAGHKSAQLDADADTIAELVFGSLAVDRLGLRHPTLKNQIRQMAKAFGPCDYFWFDPTCEPPPKNIPEDCDCGAGNERGETLCSECKCPLKMMSAYEVWLDALIRSYVGEQNGTTLGAGYAEVIKWLPNMRPYPECRVDDSEFIWSIYAVTHVVYTLNDYDSYKLDPRQFPQEFDALRGCLSQVIAAGDSETIGEVVDCLKVFGVADDQPDLRDAIEYLLMSQNPDGSWGPNSIDDDYERCHTTITAMNGLDHFAWLGVKVQFPETGFPPAN